MKKIKLNSKLLFTLAFFLISCKCKPSENYNYKSPIKTNDGIEVASLEDVNIDTLLLQQAVNAISCDEYGEVHSMLIYKDNKLVFEEYFSGHEYIFDGDNNHGESIDWNKSSSHIAMSTSKSFVSAAIGIAIDKGYIKNVDQSIFDFLPDYQHLRTSAKDKITVEHLLTMTSGLEWNEWGEPYDIIKIWFQDKDPLSYILEKALINKPGTNFTYSGGNTILLGEIIKNASGLDLDQFLKKHLFDPLEIPFSDWKERFDNGVIDAGGGLYISPRSMLKFGKLYLNNGVYDGQQIIPKTWIEKSTTQFANNQDIDIAGHDSGIHSYSYSWWLRSVTKSGKEMKLFHAVGWGGQEIIVVPELKSVVVFTGGNYVSESESFEIFEKYILAAMD